MQKMIKEDALENSNIGKAGFSFAETLKGPALNKLHLYKVGLFHGFTYYTWARQRIIANFIYYLTKLTDWQSMLAYPFIKLGIPDSWIPR